MLQKYTQSEAEQSVKSYMSAAGYKNMTLLQEKTVPLAIQGRDLLIETRNCSGKSAAILLPILLRLPADSPGIKAAIIVSDVGKAKRVRNQFRRFSSHQNNAPLLIAVGQEENIKKELKILSKTPDIIVGTPTRIIDHVRRGNIVLDQIEITAIYMTDQYENGFDKDIQYIFSKLPNNQQTLLFTDYMNDQDISEFSSLLRRPAVFSYSDFHNAEGSHLYFYTEKKKEKPDLLVNLFATRDIDGSIVVCKTDTIAVGIEKKLNMENIPARLLMKETPQNEYIEIRKAFEIGKIQAIVTTVGHSSHITIKGIKNIVYFNPPIKPETYLRNISHVDKENETYTIVSLVCNDEEDLIKQLEETTNMTIKHEENPDENDVIMGTVKKLVQKVKEEEHPEELNRYKKLFKKHVPLTLRGYVTAYLLKTLQTGEKKSLREMKTLFVSVGKNRRVYPKDLARFFSSHLNLKRSEIGNIKVLDSYSFIDIPEEYSQRAINQLDGKEFRGRKVTVNHARKKEEKNSSVS